MPPRGRKQTPAAVTPPAVAVPENMTPAPAAPVERRRSMSDSEEPSLFAGDFKLGLSPAVRAPTAQIKKEAPIKGGPKSKTEKRQQEAEDSRHGHRERLRKRFRDGGADALPDYELLEMVLFHANPRQDTKPLAKKLLAVFGSFAEVINAPPARLEQIEGVGERAVDELKLIKAAALRLLQSEVKARPPLASWQGVLDYLRASQGYDNKEAFRILFLDKRNQLIADEVQQRGTVDHTPVYVREVIARALELASTAIILVHNHPSGDPSPSRADIDMTKLIMMAGQPLGVLVHDHVIVGRQGHFSMKAARVI